MVEMATLAERGEVAVFVVRSVLVEMGTSEADGGLAKQIRVSELQRCRQTLADEATASVTPATAILVEPAAIAKMEDGLAVRPVTAFAAPLGANEPDFVR
nr:hypothetical protein [Jiella pelagia]